MLFLSVYLSQIGIGFPLILQYHHQDMTAGHPAPVQHETVQILSNELAVEDKAVEDKEKT